MAARDIRLSVQVRATRLRSAGFGGSQANVRFLGHLWWGRFTIQGIQMNSLVLLSVMSIFSLFVNQRGRTFYTVFRFLKQMQGRDWMGFAGLRSRGTPGSRLRRSARVGRWLKCFECRSVQKSLGGGTRIHQAFAVIRQTARQGSLN